jgi:SWI/SNF-related matrix-associated actin-dependent regulator 1 of chromatin subfamily A
LFTSLQLVDPYSWTDYRGYAERYCEGHNTVWGWDDRGASNIEELKNRISRYYIRREKDEILPELPPKRFIDRPIELDPDWRFKYDLAEESFGEYLISIKKKTAEEAARSLAAEKLVRLNELRQIASAGKVEMAKELIDEIIDSGEKILVFSCYNAPLKQLYEFYGKDKSVMLTGQTDEDLRRIAIEQFQSDPNKKIFFGGMASAGVGITLTAASTVLFLDQSWVPSDHIQAADRVHRPGQTAECIKIYQMMAVDTIDDYIRDVLVEKQAIIDQIIDNSAKPMTGDIQGAVMEKIEKKLIK